MERARIRDLVIGGLLEIQKNSGREVPEEMTDETRPVEDLEGFDSQNGLELRTILSKDLELPLDFNPCVSADGRRALRIREIVGRVEEAIAKEGEPGDE